MHSVVPRIVQAWPVSTAPAPIAVDAMSYGAMTTGTPAGRPSSAAASGASGAVRRSSPRRPGSRRRAHSMPYRRSRSSL
ncbi:hypothetical protein LUX39_06390 [Actinomadura madurae]|nr:hypothetical protein [Actinomadura madurae]MCQ0013466.1 hypothetical protein [Actinomadura madurae]